MKKTNLSLIATILASAATLADTSIDKVDHKITLTMVGADADLLVTYAKKEGILALTDIDGSSVYDTEDIAAWKTKDGALFDAVLTKTAPLAATIFAKPETLMALEEMTPGQLYLIKDFDGKIDVKHTSSIPNDPIELKIERDGENLCVHVPADMGSKMMLSDSGVIISARFEDKKFDDTSAATHEADEAHNIHEYGASATATAEA